MRAVKQLGVVILVAVFAGCASTTIRTDYNPEAAPTISEYQTYAWLAHPTGGDTRVNNPLVASRIESAVDAALGAKGYRKATTGNPDFRVGYHAALEGKVDIDTVNRYYGYGWGRWRGVGMVSDDYVREYDQGTLIIDVVDAASDELTWRGSAQAEVNMDAEPEQRQERINNAVQKIFERFPPN